MCHLVLLAQRVCSEETWLAPSGLQVSRTVAASRAPTPPLRWGWRTRSLLPRCSEPQSSAVPAGEADSFTEQCSSRACVSSLRKALEVLTRYLLSRRFPVQALDQR